MRKLLLLSGILILLGVPFLNATVEVRIISGTGDTGWVACAGITCSVSGAVGNYNVTSDIAIQDNGSNPLLDLSYVAHTSVANAGTIVFEAIANGYTFNTPTTTLLGNGNSSLGDEVEFGSFGGNNNTICPGNPSPPGAINPCSISTNGATLAIVGPLTVAQSASYGQSMGGGGNTVNPYELGLAVALISPTGTGTASGDIALNAVPEPASVILLGGVLLFAVTGLRRKMRKA